MAVLPQKSPFSALCALPFLSRPQHPVVRKIPCPQFHSIFLHFVSKQIFEKFFSGRQHPALSLHKQKRRCTACICVLSFPVYDQLRICTVSLIRTDQDKIHIGNNPKIQTRGDFRLQLIA